jgi:hypothetical protein
MILGIAAGVAIGLAFVIWCYCSGCWCFGADEVVVVEGSKGVDIEVVIIIQKNLKTTFF